MKFHYHTQCWYTFKCGFYYFYDIILVSNLACRAEFSFFCSSHLSHEYDVMLYFVHKLKKKKNQYLRRFSLPPRNNLMLWITHLLLKLAHSVVCYPTRKKNFQETRILPPQSNNVNHRTTKTIRKEWEKFCCTMEKKWVKNP